jgi:uncharacterized small protein (DUF1192 family)
MTDIVDRLRENPIAHAEAAAREIERLRADLDRERLRLVACGVVARADTPDSASKARQMHDDYRSDSLAAVIERVDECMALRAEVERLRAELRHAHEPLMRLQSQVDRSPHYKSTTAAIEDNDRLRERLQRVVSILARAEPSTAIQCINAALDAAKGNEI